MNKNQKQNIISAFIILIRSLKKIGINSFALRDVIPKLWAGLLQQIYDYHVRRGSRNPYHASTITAGKLFKEAMKQSGIPYKTKKGYRCTIYQFV